MQSAVIILDCTIYASAWGRAGPLNKNSLSDINLANSELTIELN